MEYLHPVMLDDKLILKLIAKIRKKEIYYACDLSVADKYRLLGALDPTISSKKIESGRKNHGTLTDDAWMKIMPDVVANIFLDSIWWEELGGEFNLANMEKGGQTNMIIRQISKRTTKLHRYVKDIDKEMDAIREGEGIITAYQHNTEISELKQKHGEALDAQRGEKRKELLKLQSITKDMKFTNSMLSSEVQRMKTDADYYTKDSKQMMETIENLTRENATQSREISLLKAKK